jgi:uncharacterized repeat protein (TIGR01451 family)
MIRCSVTVVCLVVMLSPAAYAGMNPDVKAAVHVLPHNAGRSCAKGFPILTGCEDIIDTYPGCDDVDFFPVFFDMVEYQGVEYGIVWPGYGSCSFTSCSDLTIGDIVNPGDGISHAWASCQVGAVAVMGWGWLSGSEPGSVCIVAHPTMGGINVGDCTHGLDHAVAAYCAGLCGEEGDLYCGPILDPLVLSKTDGLAGACVIPEDSIAYLIAFDNSPNTSDVHNVVITDHLPSDVVYLSSTAGGTYDASEHTVNWTVGTLPAGGEGLVGVRVAVPAGTAHGKSLTNTCEIKADETLLTEAVEHTRVCPDVFSPLGLAKKDQISGQCVNAGDTIAYTIVYDNAPNVYDVHSVILTDQLPAEVNYISCSAGGVYEAGTHTVTWTIGTLAGGTGGSVDLVVRVKPDAPHGASISTVCEITGEETGTSVTAGAGPDGPLRP